MNHKYTNNSSKNARCISINKILDLLFQHFIVKTFLFIDKIALLIQYIFEIYGSRILFKFAIKLQMASK